MTTATHSVGNEQTATHSLTNEQDPDVPEYTGCQNTTAPWGSICPDCGERLPRKRRSNEPMTWMAARNVERVRSDLDEDTRCPLPSQTGGRCRKPMGHGGYCV